MSVNEAQEMSWFLEVLRETNWFGDLRIACQCLNVKSTVDLRRLHISFNTGWRNCVDWRKCFMDKSSLHDLREETSAGECERCWIRIDKGVHLHRISNSSLRERFIDSGWFAVLHVLLQFSVFFFSSFIT